MFLARLFGRRSPAETAAVSLYRAAVEKARDPVFYAELAVPDTVNGRFDMIVIHVMLLFRRLRGGGAAAHATSEALLSLMFSDMDRSLREMGVGDMSVGKHVKKMAKAFYGRAEMYEAGLEGTSDVLESALTENLYRHEAAQPASRAAIAAYMKRLDTHLAAQAVEAITGGAANFQIPVK